MEGEGAVVPEGCVWVDGLDGNHLIEEEVAGAEVGAVGNSRVGPGLGCQDEGSSAFDLVGGTFKDIARVELANRVGETDVVGGVALLALIGLDLA